MDFESLINYLESNGFEIIEAGGNCPIQVGANHRDGWSFYFRARGSHVSLELYDCHLEFDEALPDEQHLLWEGTLNNWVWPDAGWLEPEEYGCVLHMLLADGRDCLN